MLVQLLTVQRAGGYPALLVKLYKLSPSPGSDESPAEASSSSSPHTMTTSPIQRPTTAILSALLAHIFSNYYTMPSLFNPSLPPAEIVEKLGDPVLRWPAALPTLIAYLWGLPALASTTSVKGKEKATSAQAARKGAAGHFEAFTPEHLHLVYTTFRILSAALSSSSTNLFLMHSYLPDLPNILAERLFGPVQKRHYEVTINSRYDWAPKDAGEEDEPEYEWKAPPAELRTVYLGMLRRLLEAGVSREMTWRLYGLVRREVNASTGEVITKSSRAEAEGDASDPTLSAPPSIPTMSTSARRGPGSLRLEMPTGEAEIEDRLNPEVLELLRHAMKHRWPNAFVFSGGSGEDIGGLELRDMGRVWPKPDRGINFTVSYFSCWIS